MWTERVGYARLMEASGREWTITSYVVGVTMHGPIESFTYTSSLSRGNSITSKVTSLLGYSMDFVMLSLMTQQPNVLPRITADRTKDNSWPFGTGIYTINHLQESQGTHKNI